MRRWSVCLKPNSSQRGIDYCLWQHVDQLRRKSLCDTTSPHPQIVTRATTWWEWISVVLHHITSQHYPHKYFSCCDQNDQMFVGFVSFLGQDSKTRIIIRRPGCCRCRFTWRLPGESNKPNNLDREPVTSSWSNGDSKISWIRIWKSEHTNEHRFKKKKKKKSNSDASVSGQSRTWWDRNDVNLNAVYVLPKKVNVSKQLGVCPMSNSWFGKTKFGNKDMFTKSSLFWSLHVWIFSSPF